MRDYSINLSDLLSAIDIHSDLMTPIAGLAIDSRQVRSGDLFIAYPGVATDGRAFIKQAESAGAAAIVYEAHDFTLPGLIDIPSIAVPQLQQRVGELANAFYQSPSSEMQIFGVTGTNGKTTCCYLLAQALTMLDLQVAIIGTIGYGKLNQLAVASHTTPDPLSLHRLLAEFRDQGVTQVCMEVSSHALDQGRVNGVKFFCGLFTNLSHDHLDYHTDMQAYGAAKLKLFSNFHHELVVTNVADRLGASITDVARTEYFVRYGQGGDVYAEDLELMREGIRLTIEGNGVDFDVQTNLVGRVNVPNLELLVGVLLGLSVSIEDIQRITQGLQAAPGRMELYTADNKPCAVVDYAHTPDALEKALQSVRQHCAGKLWCVFGCGGDRDAAKRPIMGAAAENNADELIITNDNPRSEQGAAIASDIASGINGSYQTILDRAEAIRYAITHAGPDDWVLIAGKGHETTQDIGEERLLFSDREQVATIMEADA